MLQDYAKGEEPIPGYRLDKFLGRGGFGEVWRASGPGGIGVALKIINLDDPQALKELRAIRLVKNIRHPNLLTIFGFWLKDEDGKFLVEETASADALSGRLQSAQLLITMGLGDKNLYDRLKECRQKDLPGIPPDELLNYMEDTAQGLDHLNQPKHDLGTGPVAIQHCDIKPQNILIVGGGAQVCDFGLARVLRESHITSHSGGLGAFIYAAPELIKNNLPSAHTDQYSLAISYYELRTGTLPFEGKRAAEQIIAAHTSGTLDLSKLPVPEQLVLRRALALEPQKRFSSSEEMVRALREAWEQKPAPIDFAEWPKPGRELVGYKLLRLVGQGENGQRWEAVAPGGVQAAVTVIPISPQEPCTQELKALDLLMSVEHDHLLELNARFVLDSQGRMIPDQAFQQHPLLSGGAIVLVGKRHGKNLLHELQAYQREGYPGIPTTVLLGYLRQAAEALDFLNIQHSIQHRNIKPENLLVVGETVKIGDFSRARVLASADSERLETSRGLDLRYAPPEALSGMLSRWSDQYSLALSYYQLCTGVAPLFSEALPSGGAKSSRAPILGPAPELDLDLLPELERDIVRRAVSAQAEQRFPSCTAMAEALDEAWRKRPLVEPAPPEEESPVAATPEQLRLLQAKRFYDAGWGKELGYRSFADYLETIPEVPEWPAEWAKHFDRTILVDARLPLLKMCALVPIDVFGDETTFVDFSPERVQRGVYWIRCHDGRRNRNRSVRDFRRKAKPDEEGLTLVEGVALCIQDRSVLQDHYPVLPGSVMRRRGLATFLRSGADGVRVDWMLNGDADQQFGVASRGCLSPEARNPLKDLRILQAKRLFHAGWGKELGCRSFADYLATIPEVPEWPRAWADRFDRTILVDARVPLRKTCELLQIGFLGDDETLVDFAPEKVQQGVYWINCQDGRKHHNRAVRDFRRSLPPDEVGLTIVEGIALYAQDSTVLRRHCLVLPGSALRRRGLVVFLRYLEDAAFVDWIWSSHADPQFGAASCGR